MAFPSKKLIKRGGQTVAHSKLPVLVLCSEFERGSKNFQVQKKQIFFVAPIVKLDK